MHHLILLFCVVFTFSTTIISAQVSDFRWTEQGVGVGHDLVRQIATDNFGNVYATGWFDSPTITFGSTTLTCTNTSANLFLVEYDPFGALVWARSAGGTNVSSMEAVKAFGITCDAMGNVIISGTFEGPAVVFGTATLTNWSSSSGNEEGFVAKYDWAGNVLWVRAIHGTSDKTANSVATDINGNIYLTGEFYGASISFGAITVSNPGSPFNEIYLAQYDAAGNVVWARGEGGMNHDYGSAVCVDINNNVLLTGFFGSAQLILGSDTLTNPNTGVYDILAAKFTSAGNSLWARSTGGSSYDAGKSVTTDQNGNVTIGGYSQSPAITFATTTHSNPFAPYDGYALLQYDSAGNELWMKTGQMNSNYAIEDVATDIAGNIYVTGQFDDPIITIGTSTLTCQGSSDIIVVKCDPYGNPLWSKGVGQSLYDLGLSICTDLAGTVYFGGNFMSYNIYFGTTMLTNTFAPCTTSDPFISSLDYTTGDVNTQTEHGIVFPNPSMGSITLSGATVMFDITVTNISGEVVMRKEGQESNEPISLDLAPGMYFLEMRSEGSNKVERLIIR